MGSVGGLLSAQHNWSTCDKSSLNMFVLPRTQFDSPAGRISFLIGQETSII